MAFTTPYIIAGILLLVIIIALKTVHFYKNIKHRKLKYWFYFDRVSIINSSSLESEKAKKSQNLYTLIATAFLALTVFLLMLSSLL